MMDSYEVYQRYLNAKKRFNEELNAIQKAYISSNYKFKEGDIVKIKGERLESFTDYLYVEKIFFYEHRDYPTDENYKEPIVKISGTLVDEDGYEVPFCPPISYSPIERDYSVCDVEIEVTNIRYKGFRGR